MRLTERERQILAMIANDVSDKEIARCLGVQVRTVRTHVERLFRRNGVHSRAAAVSAWLHHASDDALSTGSDEMPT